MKVDLALGGTIVAGGQRIAFRPTLALLDAVLAERSLQRAASRLGLSYRSAWGRFATLEAALGRPVIHKIKGHGSVLTSYGVAFHQALTAASHGSEDSIQRAERALAARLETLSDDDSRPLRLAVSHDAVLLDALSGIGGIAVTIAGSMDALARLASGDVDGAGFHFGATIPEPGSSFARVLADASLQTRPVLRREQGLILARGNPQGISGVADLTKQGVRFVNRQRGAGTRIWLDRLCAAAGVRTEEIRGYDTEEFTHQAVAALIASGAADVGMATRAVAERFDLDFLTLGEETYFLAIRTSFGAERLEAIASAIGMHAAAVPGYA